MSRGLGFPVSEMRAGRSSRQARTSASSCGNEVPSMSSGCSSAAARFTCWSRYSTDTWLAPTRYASVAIARATGACSTRPVTTTR